MRQRIDLAKLHEEAIEQLKAGGQNPDSSRQWPAEWPFTLDQLLCDEWVALEDCLSLAATARQDADGQTSVAPGAPRRGLGPPAFKEVAHLGEESLVVWAVFGVLGGFRFELLQQLALPGT
jgi:hypothetical protein